MLNKSSHIYDIHVTNVLYVPVCVFMALMKAMR